MNNETKLEKQKSDQKNIQDLLTEFLDDLDNLKSSDPELYNDYKASLLNLLSDPKN